MSRKPEPLPYARAYLQCLVSIYVGADDFVCWQRLFRWDLRESVLPAELSLMGEPYLDEKHPDAAEAPPRPAEAIGDFEREIIRAAEVKKAPVPSI